MGVSYFFEGLDPSVVSQGLPHGGRNRIAIDLVRKGGVEHTQVHPMEPLRHLLHSFIERGGKVWACPPCTHARGYDQESLIEGVVIHGASVVFERVKQGAATLTF